MRQAAIKPRPAPVRGAVQHLKLKLSLFAGICLLPSWGVLQMLLGGHSWLPAVLYPAASLLSVFLYWNDKRKARNNTWRTPEKWLHVVELCGGWPGALVAQQAFRHKTRKLSFQLIFWAIVAAHQVFWLDYLVLAGRGLGRLFQ